MTFEYDITKQVIKPNGDRRHHCFRLADLSKYGTTMGYFLQLSNAAKQDFPGLKDEDINIRMYSGDRHKGMMGIEFQIHADLIPVGYEAVERFDTTY
jgi:hypothetical protein